MKAEVDGLDAMYDEPEEQRLRLVWYERQLEPLVDGYLREFAEMMRGPSSRSLPVKDAAQLFARHIEKRYANFA